MNRIPQKFNNMAKTAIYKLSSVWLTLVIFTITLSSAECPIECYCDYGTITCSGNKILTRFPTELFGSENDNLHAFTRFELHDYNIYILSKSEFTSLISVNENVTELSLSRNSIVSIDNETFLGHEFPQLKTFDLSDNKLNYFMGGKALKKLKVLDLSSNELQQVYGLSEMNILETIDLRSNRISYLEPNIFQNLQNLQYINLDGNTIESLNPSVFSNLPSLVHLILSNNPIRDLHPGFHWNSQVQFIDVSHVGLTFIPTSLTQTVRDFRCASNNLTIITQTDFESYPNVGLIILDENYIETIEEDAFGRLEFLTRLWINGNRLVQIPQKLPESLTSLHLEENHIQNLSATDFKNLKNLEELNLHGNSIPFLPAFIFDDLSSLKSLDLRNNKIDEIYHDSFAGLNNLVSLDLSQNPIKVIVTGAFTPLGKLSLLHASRWTEGELEMETSGLKSMENLQILTLADSPSLARRLVNRNEDESFPLSVFPSLIELNLQRCDLHDIKLVTSSLLTTNLQVVKLSGNPWDCEQLLRNQTFHLSTKLADEPECQSPKEVQGIKLTALNYTQRVVVDRTNFSANGTSSATTQLSTKSPQSSSNSGVNSNANTSQGLVTSGNRNTSQLMNAGPSENNSDNKTNVGTTGDNISTNVLHEELEAMPTQSYFDSAVRQSVDPANNNSIWSFSVSSGESGETKTNDDTIIDSTLFAGQKDSGSIDGFPSSHPDPKKKSHREEPRLSYLRSTSTKALIHTNRSNGGNKATTYTTEGATIIIKTLIISAVSCLGSVLFLMLLGYSVYHMGKMRSFPIPWPSRLRAQVSEDASKVSPRMAYSRFGKDECTSARTNSFFHHEGPKYHHDSNPEMDADQVELSGITNRLYFENEEIYHIT